MTEKVQQKNQSGVPAKNQQIKEPVRQNAPTREGVVVSNKMQKTIIVEVTRLMQHPRFKKVIRKKVKYAVHDEKNEAKMGSKVEIVQTRPLSKTKRWRLVKVLTS